VKKYLALIFLFFLALVIIALFQAIFSTSLAKYPRRKIQLEEQQLKVAVADTPQLQKQGLRGVESLGNLDGMLFVYSEPVQHSFTMEDVLIPLTIGFYSSEGKLIEEKQLELCSDECPTYTPQEEFQYALEIPQQSEINLNANLQYD